MVRLNIDNCVELAKGLGVKRVPHTFLLFKGSILESQLGYDPSALKDLVQTALLVDQAENDESVATQVLNQAETLIREDKFEEAMQLLHDLKSWEGWGRTFACEIAAGLAWCQLKTKKDPVLARQAFESVTEAQIADLDEASYWSDLLYQIDSEIERVKAEAGPDLREYELLGKIDLDHADTGK